jgi:hypothetical protein
MKIILKNKVTGKYFGHLDPSCEKFVEYDNIECAYRFDMTMYFPEYKNVETHAPHTQKPSYITNPNFDRKLCKHLIKIFDILNI